MTDCKAEQEMELEALEAILMDEFGELEGPRPAGWPPEPTCYRIVINNEEEEVEGEYQKRLDIVFAHTPNYPDEPPLVKARSIQGMTNEDLTAINKLLEEQVQANLGMASIYTLVAAAKEWLADQVAGVRETGFELDPKEAERLAAEAEEKRLAEIRAHGTPVSRDTFAAWKAKFDAEQRLAKVRIEGVAVDKDRGLTGKAFFLSQEANGRQAIAEGNEEEEEEDEEDYLDEIEEEEEEEELSDDEDEDEDEDELLDELLSSKTKT